MKNRNKKYHIIIKELKKLLDDNYGRFSNYQKLAPCVQEKIGSNIDDLYSQNQISLDNARYKWLIKQTKPNNMSTIEIGSNLGYFVLRLISEFGATAEAYEPVIEYSRATFLMAELCNLDNQINCIAKGLLKEDLLNISESDLIIHLNVLHHAGVEYDRIALNEKGSWEKYALEYLSLLRNRSKRLFFQTGNISSENRLFPMEDSISYIYTLLKKSGWNIKAIGAIENFDYIEYFTYTIDNLDKVPITKCIRNLSTGLVDYFRDEKIVASLPTGLAARPLWYCESDE